MTMGDLVNFPRRDETEPPIVLPVPGRAVVLIHTDGRVQYDGNVDAASMAIWDAVGARVAEEWQRTELPRLQKKVRALKALLDEYAPQWREEVKRRVDG